MNEQRGTDAEQSNQRASIAERFGRKVVYDLTADRLVEEDRPACSYQ